MSETENPNHRRAFRRTLLSTASALALLALLFDAERALAEDTTSDRPTVWIELGGQMERDNVLGEKFDPPFLNTYSDSPVIASGAPFDAQKSPLSFGVEGHVSYQPAGSDWVFSAALRYGRASSRTHIHQSKGVDWPKSLPIYTTEYTRYGHHSADTKLFSDTVSKSDESHTIIDFQVGKDVGLGLFGPHNDSSISFGVRFAQFSSSRDVSLRMRPDLHFYSGIAKYWHTYGAHELAKRSFQGMGPSLSWSNATALFGNDSDGAVTLDWGINAAILIGRQHAAVRHNSTSGAFHPLIPPKYTTSYQSTVDAPRARFVAVPNAGAFGGLSFRYSVARVSFGYRADVFFGAMDGGNNAAKGISPSFYGPFATVGIGIGG
jgi:iron complex outermembrane receptor protein